MKRMDEPETAFVFDVDGTLVASSLQLTDENRETLLRFCEAKPTYLISGSEFEKTRWQVGDLVFRPVRGVFNCNGNSFRVGGLPVYQSSFDVTGELADFLHDLLAGSGFPLRTGRHIDRRAGLVNFSVVGRNADLSERRKYVAWDQANSERKRIAEQINRRFGDIVSAQVAGETGIDLVEPGNDKGSIYRFLKDPFHCLRTGYSHAGFARIVFFGDNCQPGGNDYPLAMQLDQRIDTCHEVMSIGDTYSTLKRILSDAA